MKGQSGTSSTGKFTINTMDSTSDGICSVYTTKDFTFESGTLVINSGDTTSTKGTGGIGAGRNVTINNGSVTVNVCDKDSASTTTSAVGINAGYLGSGNVVVGVEGDTRDDVSLTVNVYNSENSSVSSAIAVGASSTATGSTGSFIAYSGTINLYSAKNTIKIFTANGTLDAPTYKFVNSNVNEVSTKI